MFDTGDRRRLVPDDPAERDALADEYSRRLARALAIKDKHYDTTLNVQGQLFVVKAIWDAYDTLLLVVGARECIRIADGLGYGKDRSST